MRAKAKKVAKPAARQVAKPVAKKTAKPAARKAAKPVAKKKAIRKSKYMMKPDPKFIKIATSAAILEKFITEVMLLPRLKSIEWSKITKQTPGLKIGYPAQHIASLLTGVEGKRSAARGDDLSDGSEVKGCNRIDQLDTCTTCRNKVLRHELICSSCKSTHISRKDDSKWLLTIKSESELELYTKKIDRLILILLDYPNFSSNDFETLTIKAYEIWPKHNPQFQQLLYDYYNSIYLEHIKLNASKTPAPKNLWPYSFQFYMCKPLKTYECLISSINTKPSIKTLTFVEPTFDRANIEPEQVPTEILKFDEIEIVFNTHQKELTAQFPKFMQLWNSLTQSKRKQKETKELLYKTIPFLPSDFIECLELRDTSKATPHATKYSRR